MKQNTLFALVCLLPFLGAAQAEETVAVDYDARVKSVAIIKEQLERRDARFKALRGDLSSLDARVEEQIDYIIKTLSGAVDSQDSKTRVANLKEDVINSLVRNIGVYRSKRMDVYERMRKDPRTPRELSEKELKVFDERIGKRIKQVMELARSFPGHTDVAKYETEGTSYWNGWSRENVRISDEWRQNRRNSESDDKVRRDLLKRLDEAMDDNASRRAELADNLANRKLSETDRIAQQEELGRIDAAVDFLRMERRELIQPAAVATRKVSLNEAQDFEHLIDAARSDLAKDFADIMSKFSELDAEAIRIHSIKANLEAREKWLENNPPPAQ